METNEIKKQAGEFTRESSSKDNDMPLRCGLSESHSVQYEERNFVGVADFEEGE